MMSRRKQSNPKSVKRDDLPGGMEEESSLATSVTTTTSVNGEEDVIKSEDEEPIEEDGVSLSTSSSGGASPAQVKMEPIEERTAQPSEMTSLKRRREEQEPPPPPPPSLLQHHGLPFSADLLQSLQYFALLRQSLPNGSLMNLPVVAPPAPHQVSPPPPPVKQTGALNHSCPSCGICFSSVSTLSAHATYYCSKRPQPPTGGASASTGAGSEPLPAHPEAVGTPLSNGNRSLTPDQQISDDLERPSAPKIRRSGRYYACPYCSFSADKRVSLNRHMRVHVGLPLLATHPVSPPPLPPPPPPIQHISTGPTSAEPSSHRSLSDQSLIISTPEFRLSKMVAEEQQQQQASHHLNKSGPETSGNNAQDRYCSDCKIQFSSFKTFQVHKQHYCQSRKPASGTLPAGIPEEVEKLNQHPMDGAGSPMTILVLPTHPPIVVPLCILQSARLLTAEQPMPARSIIVSPHGDIQFRTESPEHRPPPPPATSSSGPAPARVPTPGPEAPSTAVVRDEQALDLSSKTSEVDDTAEDTAEPPRPQPTSSEEPTPPPQVSGGIRVREEMGQVAANQTSPAPGGANPALTFLPPKVLAELEALGMCLGVPSGHDMGGNPAQWLAMLENAVLQASSLAQASSPTSLVKPASNVHLKVRQAQRPSSAIPCEECNISFRRMESYLVHKQYYCAARHQPAGSGGKDAPPPPPAPLSEINGNNIPPEESPSSTQREPVIQRTSSGKMPCPACGIEFESAITLQAHRSFYCSKREASDPAVQLVKNLMNNSDGRKSNPEIPPSAVNVVNNTPSISPAASGSGGGTQPQLAPAGIQVQPQSGWKCPCCDTVSPTAASAQKHVETHSNVRAFRCSVCGYRGNTLRGMRTHVRIHFDRRSSPAELCEDNYISCIMSGSSGSSGSGELFSPTAGGGGGMSNSSPPDVDQIFKSLGIPPEVCAKVLSSAQESGGGVRPGRELGGSSLAGLQFLQLAQRIANHSPGPTTGAGCRSDKLFLCDLCCYSSSYRGNVIRHSKLVHGREISDVAVVSSNFLQQAVNSKGASGNPSMPSVPGDVRMMATRMTENSPPLRAPSAGTPILMSGSPDETIQVKIDPEDLLLIQNQSSMGPASNDSSSHHSGHSPLAEYKTQPAAAAAAGTGGGGADPFRKHCKSCNITFTYMNTFLAHKKYYCSSHAPLDHHDEPDDELDEEDGISPVHRRSSSPPSGEAQRSEATPT